MTPKFHKIIDITLFLVEFSDLLRIAQYIFWFYWLLWVILSQSWWFIIIGRLKKMWTVPIFMLPVAGCRAILSGSIPPYARVIDKVGRNNCAGLTRNHPLKK